MISHGEYIPTAATTVEGREAFELMSRAEFERRREQREAAFLAEHPEIHAAVPWAEEITVDAPNRVEAYDIWAERDFGKLRLSRRAEFADGVLTWDDDTSAPAVMIDHWKELTLEDMRELASALMGAIPVVEEALAGEVRA